MNNILFNTILYLNFITFSFGRFLGVMLGGIIIGFGVGMSDLDKLAKNKRYRNALKNKGKEGEK